MAKSSIWIGYAGVPADGLTPVLRKQLDGMLQKDHGCINVPLTALDFNLYYNGFSNNTLWPLFHYFQVYTSYSRETWEGYRAVNRKFADAILKHTSPADTIWIHDYQLMLVPGMIREARPDARSGFFLHSPFPSHDLYRLLPCRHELLAGLLGADLIGFHTWSYARHFLSSVLRLCGVENVFGRMERDGRIVQVDVFPMGIDAKRFADVDSVKGEQASQKLADSFGDTSLVLSIDRLDYTKGLLQRLQAWERFLENTPKWHGKVTLLVLAVPTRARIPLYRELKDDFERAVGRINGRFSTINWQPIHYFYRTFDFPSLRALYQRADISLVTPLRDGMNLVAKEYVAAHASDKRGVLVLSETAGAAEELGEAILVNPNDIDEVAAAIGQALSMTEEEQTERMSIMLARVFRSTVSRWAADFMEKLEASSSESIVTQAVPVTAKLAQRMTQLYKTATSRLLLLDYDGTLTGLQKRPELAKPDRALLVLLERLAADPANHLALVSGRMQVTLEEWFGHLNATLVAEHGCWKRVAGEAWEMLVQDDLAWKDGVLPVLERYTDSTPGAFIEIKAQAMAWHYRNVDPDLVPYRLQELRLHLRSVLANLPVGVLDGNKVLEIRNLEISKSRAATTLLEQHPADFIFAAGDDTTDEEMFSVLPESAWSVHVGGMLTRARCAVGTHHDVRQLLTRFVEAGDE
jgi:trehalose 6-phosphate synthase/phosphatase